MVSFVFNNLKRWYIRNSTYINKWEDNSQTWSLPLDKCKEMNSCMVLCSSSYSWWTLLLAVTSDPSTKIFLVPCHFFSAIPRFSHQMVGNKSRKQKLICYCILKRNQTKLNKVQLWNNSPYAGLLFIFATKRQHWKRTGQCLQVVD